MKLKPLPNTVVHVPTEEEFHELLYMLLESGFMGTFISTHLYLEVDRRILGFGDDAYRYESSGWRIIDLQTFKKEQGLMKKELKDMEVGDVLIDEYGGERTVLEVLTQSFLPSVADRPAITSMWITFASAEKCGWHFKDQPAPKKMTLEEVSEKLGYDVEIIKGEDDE